MHVDNLDHSRVPSPTLPIKCNFANVLCNKNNNNKEKKHLDIALKTQFKFRNECEKC